jgi:predicted small lipoprotein YifL
MSPRRCDVIVSERLGADLTIRCATFAAVLLTSAALALSACGRAGPLEPPPGPAAVPTPTAQLTRPDGSPVPASAQDAALKNGFDAQGNPVSTPGQKRSFILDPLLQ